MAKITESTLRSIIKEELRKTLKESSRYWPEGEDMEGGDTSHLNQQLLDIHQQKQKLDGPKSTAPSKVTNNAIFVGSTNELNKMIKNMNKGE